MKRFFAALAISTLALSASAADDLTITFKFSDGATTAHYFTKDRIRMNSGKTDTILDFVTGKIVTIEPEEGILGDDGRGDRTPDRAGEDEGRHS